MIKYKYILNLPSPNGGECARVDTYKWVGKASIQKACRVLKDWPSGTKVEIENRDKHPIITVVKR